MKQSESILLDLIKESLFGISREYPADTDWDAVYKEAQAQAVLGIVSDIIPKQCESKWEIRKDRNDANYIQNLYVQEQLIDLLDSKEIPLAILKGGAAAIYYPIPSQRTMGDIDFIVPTEKFEETRTLLKESGYKCLYGSKGKVERESIFYKDDKEIELHYRFSDPDLDVEKFITDGLKHTEIKSIDDFEFPILPKLANGIVLLAHMRHHLQMGMGLRQVIDWMMYVDKELNDEFWRDSFSKAAVESRLDNLAIVVTKMCQEYLGLKKEVTWCKGANSHLCRSLLDNVILSGNFGNKNGQGRLVETVTINFRKEGIIRYLQKAGEKNWKAYHVHHWLKPFCCFYQIGRYIKQGIQTKRGEELIADIGRSKERYKLLKELKII